MSAITQHIGGLLSCDYQKEHHKSCLGKGDRRCGCTSDVHTRYTMYDIVGSMAHVYNMWCTLELACLMFTQAEQYVHTQREHTQQDY